MQARHAEKPGMALVGGLAAGGEGKRRPRMRTQERLVWRRRGRRLGRRRQPALDLGMVRLRAYVAAWKVTSLLA